MLLTISVDKLVSNVLFVDYTIRIGWGLEAWSSFALDK